MKPVLRAAAQNSAEKIHLIRMETHLQDSQEGVTEADMIDTIVLVEAMEATTHSVFYRDVWPALQRYVRLLERNDKWWHPEGHRETLAVEVTLIDVTGRKQCAGGFRILDEDGIYRQRQEGIPEGDDGYC